MMNQFLAWLHSDSSLQPARAPAEVMLLKSKPHFMRCRELKSQASHLPVFDRRCSLWLGQLLKSTLYLLIATTVWDNISQALQNHPWPLSSGRGIDLCT